MILQEKKTKEPDFKAGGKPKAEKIGDDTESSESDDAATAANVKAAFGKLAKKHAPPRTDEQLMRNAQDTETREKMEAEKGTIGTDTNSGAAGKQNILEKMKISWDVLYYVHKIDYFYNTEFIKGNIDGLLTLLMVLFIVPL